MTAGTPVNAFEAMLTAEKFRPPVNVQRDAGYAMNDHAHDFDACALITSGEFTIVITGVAKTYTPGEIFRIPAGTPHEERAGAEGVTYLAGRREAAT